MASADWKKNKGGTNEGVARMLHATRHDGKDVEYRNKDIKKDKISENYRICAPGEVLTNRTAKDELKRLEDRVKVLDELKPPQRIRKDRVKTISFTIPAPEGLVDAQERAFFQLAYEETAKFLGGYKNATFGYVHKDEIHEYIDARDKKRKMSRAHMHLQTVAWTEEFGVNAKNCETKARMRELNKLIDERCRKELGISFLKSDVSQHDRDYRSVEDLKLESILESSKQVKQLEQEKEDLVQKNSELIEQNSALNKRNSELEKSVQDTGKQLNNASNEIKSVENELANLERKRSDLQHEIIMLEEEADSWDVEDLRSENERLKRDNKMLQDMVNALKKGFEIVKNFLKRIPFKVNRGDEVEKTNVWARVEEVMSQKLNDKEREELTKLINSEDFDKKDFAYIFQHFLDQGYHANEALDLAHKKFEELNKNAPQQKEDHLERSNHDMER